MSLSFCLMGPQCLFQKSVVGIKGNNICGVSWLWIQHTLGIQQMLIMWVRSPNPRPHWPPSPRGPWYPCLLPVSIPNHYQMQAAHGLLGDSVLDLEVLTHWHPCVPRPHQMWRRQEEKTQASLERWPFSSGDKVCPRNLGELSLRTSSLSWYIIFKNRNGRQRRHDSLSLAPSTSSLSMSGRS